MLSIAALLVLAAAVAVYYAGQAKAVRLAGGALASLHSRPSYHGLYCALWTLLIGWGTLLIASILTRSLVEGALMGMIEQALPDSRFIERQLILSDAYSIARGGIASTDDALRREVAAAAASWGSLRLVGVLGLTALAAAVAFWRTFSQLAVDWRARNRSERMIQGILWTSAVIAILTTVGIVLSLVGETLIFFV
ncbi:MAG: phosphate ABC transporter permease family protein, partial [Pseudomonadota bacterium]